MSSTTAIPSPIDQILNELVNTKTDVRLLYLNTVRTKSRNDERLRVELLLKHRKTEGVFVKERPVTTDVFYRVTLGTKVVVNTNLKQALLDAGL
jgi:hypothetical protein